MLIPHHRYATFSRNALLRETGKRKFRETKTDDCIFLVLNLHFI